MSVVSIFAWILLLGSAIGVLWVLVGVLEFLIGVLRYILRPPR